MFVVSALGALCAVFAPWSPLASSAALVGRNAGSPIASVKNGTLKGTFNAAYNQDFFLGIPYAQPPVGDLRLRNPQSLNTTFRTKEVTKYHAGCVGYGSDNWGYDSAEDCLALNVVRPSGCNEDSKLPIALWIHGGGFYQGGSADRRYNLSFIVQNSVAMGKPIIGVSINYRLAQWGFLAGNQVQKEGSTNLGLKDQRLALNWVRENIAAFGGDHSKVTIWGESAGGGSVAYHALMFGGREDKLFRGIMSESTYVNANQANKTLAEINFQNVTSAAGCTGTNRLECLRKLPFDKLNAAFNATGGGNAAFAPVNDGDLLRDYNTNQLNRGQFVKAALLVGENTDEGTAFGTRGVNTDEEFAAAVAAVGPDPQAVSEVERLYPDIPSKGIPATLKGRPEAGTSLGVQWKRAAAFGGDFVMHSLRRQMNQQWTKHGVKNYAYRFNARPNGLPDSTGVTHFQEVAFVFDNTLNLGYGEPISAKPFEGRGPAYTNLAKLMSRMWVSFVHDLDPNHHNVKGTARWPAYDDGQKAREFVFDANVTSYAEPDTYRHNAIQFIIDNSVKQFKR